MAVDEELYCLLVPLDGFKIILPRDLVVEVLNRGSIEPASGETACLLGYRTRNQQPIPVISLEVAAGLPHRPTGNKSRLLVVHAVTGRLEPPYFAILTLGYPYLLRIDPRTLRTHENQKLAPGFVSRAQLGGEAPLIPDFDWIEGVLAALRPVPA
jgi:chemotaxis signal transduction protein